MNGAAFGLGPDFDLRRRNPRIHCEDCGAHLLYNADALGIWAAADIDPEDRRGAAEILASGGVIYGCPVCGLLGLFTPWMVG